MCQQQSAIRRTMMTGEMMEDGITPQPADNANVPQSNTTRTE